MNSRLGSIHRSAWKGYSAKFAPRRVRWGKQRGRRNRGGQEQGRVAGQPQEDQGTQEARGEGRPNGGRTGRVRLPDGGIQRTDRAAPRRGSPQGERGAARAPIERRPRGHRDYKRGQGHYKDRDATKDT